MSEPATAMPTTVIVPRAMLNSANKIRQAAAASSALGSVST